jgi:predicted amidophosphoribosyltransferase
MSEPQKRKYKSHNSLGKPLCQACGRNPTKHQFLRCGRCLREDRPVNAEKRSR